MLNIKKTVIAAIIALGTVGATQGAMAQTIVVSNGYHHHYYHHHHHYYHHHYRHYH